MASLPPQSSKDSTATAQDSSLPRLAAASEARADAFFADKNYKAALDAVIQSAELYFRARREALTPSEKQKLDQKCAAIVAKAERWKKAQAATEPKVSVAPNPPPAGSPPRKRPAPKSVKKQTTKEKLLLLQSSKINGGVFPPWQGPPDATEFRPGPFLDPAGRLQLSESQKRMLDDWKRPHEIYRDARIFPVNGEQLDLTQDVVTDCSVVASLCAGARREEKGFGKIVTNIIYPQDDRGRPAVSPSGKYIVKIFFNGCFRKVVIDDYLPASSTKRALYATCRSNPSIFGPALVEKAYLKIMGGYDFPGSNSGTDLFALAGWIPEHVFLQSDEIVFSALWRRISNAWATGDVLVTLGTGRLTTKEEIILGLIGEHDYAVLEMKEEDGQRMMLVKNPWSDGTVWKGTPTADDEDDQDFDAPSPPDSESGLNMAASEKAFPSREPLKPGVFWISLENICRNFASLYLNWNPTLFTHIHESHFSWDLATKVSETSFGRNPQFSISNSSSTSGPVWILLSRHLGLPSNPQEGMINNGFIALYLFDASGRRVYLSSGSTYRTPYVDSPQTLLCIADFPVGDTYTLAVSSQDLSPTIHHFSLAVYSLFPLTVDTATETFPYALTLSSSWTDATAGGNAQSREYPKNPQFMITLPTPTPEIGLLLETPSLHPVHVKLVHSKGERIASVTTRDIIAESGEYQRSTALAIASVLRAGKYTIVASTFEAGQLGNFSLTLLSTSSDAMIKELPSETAGCFETHLKNVWPHGRKKLVFPMDVGRFMGLWVKARSTSALRLRILRAARKLGEVEDDVVVAESGGGNFEDLPMGVRTQKAWFEWLDGGYQVVLERLGTLGGEEWEVTVVSESTLWVGEEMGDDEE
ncbi:hypothetical protein FN846DRAFT_977737 [Sphaerosporella brunnea]|uniref:Calpain catalytic domain-containing protein n=1 Tax=Sphaerosporella brunnea TaxID=1250544 RepID=A0A5J5EFC4_9PEZI|nr:hypothetical protein FN846DRAFT_977737 [Sphaerosporella brunnea]